MSDRRVAVLGAGGFVGYRLAEWLTLTRRADVRAIARSHKSFARLARFAIDGRIADATDAAALARELDGCDVLFHCVVGDRDTIVRSAETAYTAAAAAGVRRLVYLSSAVVHGIAPVIGTTESTPLIADQSFEYNVSKVLAEQALARLRQDGRVETVVLRPGIVFGPRSQAWTGQIASELLRGSAYLVEDGRGICNTVYVDNLVHAMWLAAFSQNAVNEAFFVTDGDRITWRDLYGSVAAAFDIDLETVHRVSRDDVSELIRRQAEIKRMTRRKFSRLAYLARAVIPDRFKGRARAFVTPGAAPVSFGAGSPRKPDVDLEIASLQLADYALPIDKARDLLDYSPTYSFAEASARTGAWLRFALGQSASESRSSALLGV